VERRVLIASPAMIDRVQFSLINSAWHRGVSFILAFA
jgi:hypothetical protein